MFTVKGPEVYANAEGVLAFTDGGINMNGECLCTCLIGYTIKATDILEAGPIHYMRDGTLAYLHSSIGLSKRWGCFQNFCVSEPEADDAKVEKDRYGLTSMVYVLNLHGEDPPPHTES